MTGSGRNTRPGAIVSKRSKNVIDIQRLGFFHSFFFPHTHEVIQKLRSQKLSSAVPREFCCVYCHSVFI